MTKIEWTEKTWNPIVGCSIVSPGCTNCYAMKMAARLERIDAAERAAGRTGMPHYAGTTRIVKGNAVWTGKLARASDRVLTEPLRRKKPTMYFVNSMSDLFHEDVPDAWIDVVFAIMALTPQHTYQVLTKRSARMRDYMTSVAVTDKDLGAIAYGDDQHVAVRVALMRAEIQSPGACLVGVTIAHERAVWPLPNVWLGVSAERQQEADARIPDLLATPAAVRFVSAEPLLGPIDFTRRQSHPAGDRLSSRTWLNDIDWIIVGGESGAGSRPMHPDWARSIRDQCPAAEVAFFFKQWGEHVTGYFDGDEFSVDEDTYGPNVTWRGTAECSQADGDWSFGKVGKKAAGRLLDGREHNAMPIANGGSSSVNKSEAA